MRHVQPRALRRNEGGEVVGFLYTAFQMREDEDYLSAAWVEYGEKATHAANLSATIAAFQANRTIRPSHKFAVGNVGRIRSACAEHRQRVRISHEPIDDFDAHASVRQYNDKADELLELLAEEAWAEMHALPPAAQ